jgi:hypothetical protein
MNFIGRVNENSLRENLYAFNAMHIISNEIFTLGYQPEFKDIFDIYIEALRRGKKIIGYDVGQAEFKDIGKPENLI